MSNIQFHRLEDYDRGPGTSHVICSFKTERFGYLQVLMTDFQGRRTQWEFDSLANEPDLNMFTESDAARIEQMTRIVWKLVHETPAAKERFES